MCHWHEGRMTTFFDVSLAIIKVDDGLFREPCILKTTSIHDILKINMFRQVYFFS